MKLLQATKMKIAACALLATTACAQSSTFSQSNVPTGTPLPGNYRGQYRPQIHYSPPSGFMNDPNGMFVDADGVWHLYYQYNPTGVTAGNQHWGHATSKDLYHWENQPIALFPPTEDEFVFSGSAFIDHNNTSGAFPNQDNGVVAMYTVAAYPNGQAGPQQQYIAFSYDGGYTFTPYEGNPVIPSTSSQFRDPKVFRYDDYWVAAIAYSQEFAIGFFTSSDLKNWTATSNFSYAGLLGAQYECPNLVEMPLEGGENDSIWVLYVSINPGAPLGGSVGEYWPGNFNGTHFVAVDAAARIADFGKDNYAGQWFSGTAKDTSVSIAWASNWQYTNVVPTDKEGWRSVMSLPRKNSIAKATRIGYVLKSEPYDITPVRGAELTSKDSLGNGTVLVDYSNVESNAIWFQVNATGLPSSGIASTATINFTLLSPISGESIRGGFYLGGDNPFFIDRGETRGFDNVFFTDKFSTTNLYKDSWSMIGVVDRSILEVFLEGGLFSATNTFFSNEPLTILTLKGADIPNGATISVSVYALESAWKQYENDQGVVVGNVTSGGNSTYGKRHELYNAQF